VKVTSWIDMYALRIFLSLVDQPSPGVHHKATPHVNRFADDPGTVLPVRCPTRTNACRLGTGSASVEFSYGLLAGPERRKRE